MDSRKVNCDTGSRTDAKPWTPGRTGGLVKQQVLKRSPEGANYHNMANVNLETRDYSFTTLQRAVSLFGIICGIL